MKVEKFLDRRGAAAYLLEKRGVPITPQHLANLASDGIGPPYAIVNGRALYLPSRLDQWVADQAAQPLRGRGHRKPDATEAAA
jgi:hypothetical protein